MSYSPVRSGSQPDFVLGELVRLDGVAKDYPMGQMLVPALSGVDLAISEGEFITVVGPSGCGKTTLLYIIGLLERPSGGKVFIEGVDVSGLDDDHLAEIRLSKLGFIFQTFHLVPWLTALQNVEVPLTMAELPRSKRGARAAELLSTVGLQGRLQHRPSQLSGGEQQRVAIARALANNPKLVLADEPTGNLDSATGSEILALLTQLNSERGVTLLVVTHNPEISDKADRAISMLDGKIGGEVRRV